MKFESYTSTPGLDRYPAKQRLATWTRVHRELMRGDVSYRNRYYSFVVAIISPLFVPALLMEAGTAFWITLSVLAFLGVVGALVILAFRQQRYMNQQIGRWLMSHDLSAFSAPTKMA